MSSSSRSSRKVDCSVSAGPNSSSRFSSHSPPTAARASSANGEAVCPAPRSVLSGNAITSRSRARVIAMCSSRRISATWAALVSAGSASLSSASGIGSSVRRRGPGMRAAITPSTKTWLNSRPLAACMAITCTPTGRSPATASSSRSPASATAAIERANSRAVACGERRT